MLQPGSNSSKAQKASSVAGQLTREDDVDGHGYYAFVKFYSTADASRALKELSGRLYMKGQHAQVCRPYSSRALKELSGRLYMKGQHAQVCRPYSDGKYCNTKTIKKNTNSTQNKSQTHRAKQYEVTSFLSTDCELSTETYSKNVYSFGPLTIMRLAYNALKRVQTVYYIRTGF